MKNTLAYYLSTGDLTRTQVNALLNKMYEYALYESDIELEYGGVYDYDTNGALLDLAHRSITNDEFTPQNIYFNDLKYVKTDNKQYWILSALLSSFEFSSNNEVVKVCPF